MDSIISVFELYNGLRKLTMYKVVHKIRIFPVEKFFKNNTPSLLGFDSESFEISCMARNISFRMITKFLKEKNLILWSAQPIFHILGFQPFVSRRLHTFEDATVFFSNN